MQYVGITMQLCGEMLNMDLQSIFENEVENCFMEVTDSNVPYCV